MSKQQKKTDVKCDVSPLRQSFENETRINWPENRLFSADRKSVTFLSGFAGYRSASTKASVESISTNLEKVSEEWKVKLSNE